MVFQDHIVLAYGKKFLGTRVVFCCSDNAIYSYYVWFVFGFIRVPHIVFWAACIYPHGIAICGTRPETGLHSCPRLLSYYVCYNVLVSVSSITVLGHGGLVMKGKGCLEVAWFT